MAVDCDDCRKVLHFEFPDRFRTAELFKPDADDTLDALRVDLGCPANAVEINTAVLLAGFLSFRAHAAFSNHGAQTGLAIHAASDQGTGLLGMRASAGCVRLSPENARTLFNLVRDNYRGTVPKFAYDKYTSTTMNNGLVLHDQDGNVELAPGYSVLIFIDEEGGENLEARAY